MRAMMLSAGRGVRMRPLTFSLPKAAMPVLGRPISVQLLNRLARLGVEEAVVNLHHLPGAVRETLGGGTEAGLPPVRFVFEPELLGTGGGIGNAAPLLRGAGPILIHNCDFLADIDVAGLLDAHRASGRLATLALAPARDGYSAVEVDGNGLVLSLGGLPVARPHWITDRLLFTGCHIIEENVLELIPEGRPSDIVADVYRKLAERGQVGYHLHEGFWWEFGSPHLYLDGTMALIDLPAARRKEIAIHDPVRNVGDARVAVGTGVQIHGSARVTGRAAIGFATFVSENVELEDSVIMPESWIGPGCRLRRVVVGPGVEIPAGFEAEDAIVCTHPGTSASIPPSCAREDGLVVCALSPEREHA